MGRVRNIETSRLQNFLEFQKDPISFLVSVRNKGDVVSLRTGFKPSFVVNSPEFVQEILVTKDAYFRKGRTSEVLRRTIGDGLLTTEKKEHDRQRRYHQPAFYKERLQGYAKIVMEETEKVVKSFQQVSSCSFNDVMMQLTLSIIARSMFSTDVEKDKQEIANAVSATIEQSARALFSPLLLPLAIPTKGHRIHKKAIKTLEQMIYDIIDAAKRDRDTYHMTLLGMLMDTTLEDGAPIPESEIRDQMMTMLLAGHETSANLLTWIYYALDKNPDVRQKFHEEIDQVQWDDNDPLEVLRKLPYTQVVIQEALRLYPPAWLIYREADNDVDLLGETFREGSTFMISPYSLHRNPEIFSEPERYRPERFLENSAWPKFAYFPFGGGSRSCVGSKFALMETTLILVGLSRHFSFHCLEPEPVIPEPLVSLRIKGGLTMEVRAR